MRHKKAAKLYTIKIKPSTLSPKPETLSSLCLLLRLLLLVYLRRKRDRYTDIEKERERNPLPRLEEGEAGGAREDKEEEDDETIKPKHQTLNPKLLHQFVFFFPFFLSCSSVLSFS